MQIWVTHTYFLFINVATIAKDESDVDVDEDISNTVITSASEALRYAKKLKAYIQQQNEIEVSLSS